MVAVYLIPNEGDPDLFSRAANRMYTADDGKKLTTADKDIVNINWLLIDADAKRPAGISSTDGQHEAAIKMIHDIRDYLLTLGFNSNSILVADSANGGHILVRVNLKPTTENKALIKSCIAALKARFETGIVDIDESVVNFSRVWKIYGTISKKGDFTDERPHRKAHLLEVPENIVIERIESLQTLAATEPKPETSAPAPKTTYHSKGNIEPFNVEQWMFNHNIDVVRTEVKNDMTMFVLKVCPFNPEHNNSSTAAVFRMANGALAFKCQHNGCMGNDWKQLRELLEPEYAERQYQYQQQNERRGQSTEAGDPDLHILNDTMNAQLIVRLFGNILRYDHRRERFLIWNTHRWQPDNNGKVFRLAIEAARARYQDAANIGDLKERERIANWAISSENRGRLEAAISIAKNLEPITDTGENWDINPWLLGVQNGVVDLRTGHCRDGKQSDNITMSTGVKFDANAQCPLWLATLKGIFQDDTPYIDFVQRQCGYSMTGSIKEQNSVIGWGEGANGKGIVAGVMRNEMGDYAYDAPFSTFEMNYKASIPNDIAALEHKRIVTSSETNNGTRLNEARLKAI